MFSIVEYVVSCKSDLHKLFWLCFVYDALEKVVPSKYIHCVYVWMKWLVINSLELSNASLQFLSGWRPCFHT